MKLAGIIALLACGLAACASDAHMRKVEEDGERLRRDLAETYIKKGAYDAALPFLTREIQANPKDGHLHYLYGTILRERGLYPQAEKELLTAVTLEPKNAAAWDGIGMLYDLEHRASDAEVAHRRATTLAPGNAMYWNNLGFSLYVANKLDTSIVALEKALALDPGLAVAYGNLGFAYGRRGNYKDAERCFRTAGGDVSMKVNLAIVYETNGNKEEAARLRAEAKSLDPKLDFATESKQEVR